MKKIKYETWKTGLNIRKLPTGFKIDGLEWWKTTSEPGRSKGKVKCPCCGSVTEIYIWSFMGSGKRCDGCNVFLGHSGAFVEQLPDNLC